MKIVKIVVFKDNQECSQFSNHICEKLKNIEPDKEFCGIWGEIQNNANEVIMSISATINHFIDSNKEEIIFGCCEKDYDEIIEKIDLSDCIADKVDAESILK